MAIERALLDQLHRNANVREEQYAVVRPPAHARAKSRASSNISQRGELLSIFAHANYLINLAATNEQFHANSIRSLSEELIRADQLELPFLVLHPGAHLGAGEEAGLEKIVESIDCGLLGVSESQTRGSRWKRPLARAHAWETNSSISHTLSAACVNPNRLCVCLDTAHVFAAGYDIGSDASGSKDIRVNSIAWLA